MQMMIGLHPTGQDYLLIHFSHSRIAVILNIYYPVKQLRIWRCRYCVEYIHQMIFVETSLWYESYYNTVGIFVI